MTTTSGDLKCFLLWAKGQGINKIPVKDPVEVEFAPGLGEKEFPGMGESPEPLDLRDAEG